MRSMGLDVRSDEDGIFFFHFFQVLSIIRSGGFVSNPSCEGLSWTAFVRTNRLFVYS